MTAKAFARLVLILTFTQLLYAQEEDSGEEFVFTEEGKNNVKLSFNQDKTLSQEEMTFRSMVRAQNLALAAYNN